MIFAANFHLADLTPFLVSELLGKLCPLVSIEFLHKEKTPFYIKIMIKMAFFVVKW